MVQSLGEVAVKPKDRIERYQKIVQLIHEEIEWLEYHQFEIQSGTDSEGGVSTASLIDEQKRIINMYERFIERLLVQIAEG